MGDKTKRKLRVNNNKYHVVAEETETHNRVSVYDDALRNHYPNNNDIVYNKQRKALPFGVASFLFDPDNIEKMMEQSLNEAVCKLEEKKEREQDFKNRVDRKLDAVKEAHEEY